MLAKPPLQPWHRQPFHIPHTEPESWELSAVLSHHKWLSTPNSKENVTEAHPVLGGQSSAFLHNPLRTVSDQLPVLRGSWPR